MSAFERLKADPSDMAAFESWYRETYPELFMAAFRITRGNRAMAEDICQEAILGFVTEGHIQKTRGAPEALAYLRRMSANLHVDQIRKSMRTQKLPPDSVESDHSAETEVEARDLYALLIDRLPNDDHEILGMMFAGETLERIAETLDISYSNAAVRVHRIRNIIIELTK